MSKVIQLTSLYYITNYRYIDLNALVYSLNWDMNMFTIILIHITCAENCNIIVTTYKNINLIIKCLGIKFAILYIVYFDSCII